MKTLITLLMLLSLAITGQNKQYYVDTTYHLIKPQQVNNTDFKRAVSFFHNTHKSNYKSYCLAFTAGMFDGSTEEIRHHYYKVKQLLPWLNDQWFDPSISWQNGYKYPLGKTLLVFPSDAYHCFRFINKGLIIGVMFTFSKGNTRRELINKLIFSCIAYTAGKQLMHSVINH